MQFKAKLLEVLRPILIGLGKWGLELACPVVPAVVWTAILTAVINGDLSLDQITEFMRANGIKTYPQEGYPLDPKPPLSTSNVDR